VDLDMSQAGVDELLALFVTAALGLTLHRRIHAPGDLPSEHRGCLVDSAGRPQSWISWHSDRGVVSACAFYDRAQSGRMKEHVLRISWWIGTHTHHNGWWHCNPKRPREWTKGGGT
jgi:hypothetical protein